MALFDYDINQCFLHVLWHALRTTGDEDASSLTRLISSKEAGDTIHSPAATIARLPGYSPSEDE